MNNDPSERQIKVLSDLTAISRAAAEEVTNRALNAVRSKGYFTIALSGGSTPQVLHSMLADEPVFRDRIPWDKTFFFFGDDRHVSPDSKESNFHMANDALFKKVSPKWLPAENIFRVLTENPNAYEAANDYERRIADFFAKKDPQAFTQVGDLQVPRFDLILLGVGTDGHTASLFPGTTGLREMDKLVAGAWIDKLDSYRITFTPPLLKNADAIIYLVTKADKADVLKLVLEGDSQPDRFPSQGISAVKGTTLWLLDKTAAAKLG